MKKAQHNRKLSVQREQIARLGQTELQNVIGGGGTSIVPNPCRGTDSVVTSTTCG